MVPCAKRTITFFIALKDTSLNVVNKRTGSPSEAGKLFPQEILFAREIK